MKNFKNLNGYLEDLCEKKGKSVSEVINAVGVSFANFCNIKARLSKNPARQMKRGLVLKLGRYLQLNENEMQNFLRAAGYASVSMQKAEKFITYLENLCANKKISLTQITDEAGISDSYFWNIKKKLKNDSQALMKRDLVLALGFALSLNEKEMQNFLEIAGYALSPVNERDKYIHSLLGLSLSDANVALYDKEFKILGASAEKKGKKKKQ